MADKPAHEPQPGPEPLLEPRPERIGPLAIARHVKDDGRALIIYTEERRAPDAQPRA